MAVQTYTSAGGKATTAAKLDGDVFGLTELNHNLLHQAYDAYLANGRLNLAQSKTRGLVQGSGRKPWRQKGTGRARVGSRRTPLWRGGGIVFGPTGEENYSKKINVKAKRVAIRQALSASNQAGNLRIIENITLKAPKTAELDKLLNKLDLKGYTLVVVDNLSDELVKASRNLANVEVVQSRYLNVARLLDSDTVVITKPAVDDIVKWLKPVKNEERTK